MYRINPKNPSHSLKIRICEKAYKLYDPDRHTGPKEQFTDREGTWSVCKRIGILRYRGREALEASNAGPSYAAAYRVPLREDKRRAMHKKKFPLKLYKAAPDDKQEVESPYWGGKYDSIFGISADRINEYYELTERLLESRTGGFGFGVQNCGMGRVSLFIKY